MALLLFVGISSHAQTKLSGSYQLNVDLNALSAKPEMVYISYRGFENGVLKQFYDSARVVSNQVVFKGELNEPVEVRISRVSKFIKGYPLLSDSFKIYLMPGQTQIKTGSLFNDFSTSGSVYEASYQDYLRLQKENLKESQPLSAEMKKLDKKKDSVAYAQLSTLYGKILMKYFRAKKQFIIDYAQRSPVALLTFQNILKSFAYSPEVADSLYNLFSGTYKALPLAKDIKNEIEIIKNSAIGKMAKDFSQPDAQGKMVSLSSYRGKYVLLDFWASWCAPCRGESPALVAGYQQYKDKNFTILQVSLDTEKAKDAWLKAIAADHLGAWTHVSDLQGFGNGAARLYSVNAIPQNFLIDPSGKIIAKNLRGEKLAQKLEELFGKSSR